MILLIIVALLLGYGYKLPVTIKIFISRVPFSAVGLDYEAF